MQELWIEIECATAKVAEAQRHLDALIKALGELQAWISPVRRLSIDALGLIFSMAAEDEWISPMRLASVCRFWRTAALSTPRAWSFIDLKEKRAIKHLPIFLERSGQRGLHIGVAGLSRDAAFAAVAGMADRIQCLSIPNIASDLQDRKYPSLKRLRITHESSPRAILQLTKSQFPVLQHLEFSSFVAPELPSIEAMVDVPPVQSLRLSILDGLTFYHLALKWNETLRSLELYIPPRTQFLKKYSLAFPRLRGLTFYDGRKWDVPHDIVLKTPELRSLITDADYASKTFTLHLDLDNLTHLRIKREQRLPPLSSLGRLKVLQLSIMPKPFMTLLNTMLNDPSICPELTIIEFQYPARLGSNYKAMENIISKINVREGRNLRAVTAINWHEILPEIVNGTVSTHIPQKLL